MKKILFILAVLMLSAAATVAENQLDGKLSARTRALISRSANPARLAKSPSRRMLMSDNGVNMVCVYVHFSGSIDEAAVEQYGGRVHCRYDNLGLVTASMPLDALRALAADSRVRLVEVSPEVRPTMDRARVSANSELVINGVAPLAQDYMGRGVVVGVVDQEFQLNHINFYSFDQQRYRVKRFWNQNKAGSTGVPAGFDYGREYTDSASILAAKTDVSTSEMTSGHATHVTGIAAGADRTTDYYGTAQEADLALVGTSATGTSIGDGVKYIFDYADSQGKPCVVNISMGGYLGPNDGTSTDCRILDSMVKPGHIIVAAAGNSGDSPMHLGKTFSATDTVLKTFLEMQSYYYSAAMVDIWGDRGLPYDVRFVVYKSSTHSAIWTSPYYAALTERTIDLNVDTTINGYDLEFDLSIATGVSDNNGKGEVYAEYQEESLPYSSYFGIEVRSTSGTVNMWTYEDLATFSAQRQQSYGWSDGDGHMTIGSDIGEAKNVITVGSYCSRSGYGSATEDISYFSSLGPLADSTLKPEITAPGELITSSVPDAPYISKDSYTTVKGKKYYYGAMQGTSMSSPFVTGVIATWLEANPRLDRDDILDVFRHSCRLDRYTGTDIPNNTWGYGKINAFDGIKYILGLNVGTRNPESPAVIGAYPNPTYGEFSLLFADIDDDVTVSVYDLGGREVYCQSVGSVANGEERSFTLDGAVPGVYTVRITGRRTNETIKLIKQ